MDCLGYTITMLPFLGVKAWVNLFNQKIHFEVPYLSAIGTSKAEVHCASFGIPLRVIRCKASCRGGPEHPRVQPHKKAGCFDQIRWDKPKKKWFFVKSLKAGPGISSGFYQGKCTCIKTACTWFFLYHLIPEKVHEVSSLSKKRRRT